MLTAERSYIIIYLEFFVKYFYYKILENFIFFIISLFLRLTGFFQAFVRFKTY